MSVYDRTLALHHVGDDPEILGVLLEMFREQGPDRMARVHRALADGDAPSLEREAHALKGTAATLGMDRLRDAAYAVEELAAEGKAEAAGAAVEAMRAALDEVMALLFGEQGAP